MLPSDLSDRSTGTVPPETGQAETGRRQSTGKAAEREIGERRDDIPLLDRENYSIGSLVGHFRVASRRQGITQSGITHSGEGDRVLELPDAFVAYGLPGQRFSRLRMTELPFLSGTQWVSPKNASGTSRLRSRPAKPHRRRVSREGDSVSNGSPGFPNRPCCATVQWAGRSSSHQDRGGQGETDAPCRCA